jgi:segregation and condensation protein A
MPASLAEEAISLLLELAEQGEINPWDVQVIDVVDRFLLRLAPQANTRDLSESGQAFLYAAMLVYLKAMALDNTPDPETEPSVEEDPEPLFRKPLRLEQVLQPRAVPRLNRTRPVTLKDLIQHLQDLESLLHQKTEAPPKPRPQKASRQQALTTITQLAHPENLLETTTELESLLVQLWQQGIPQIDFNDLVDHFKTHHLAPAQHKGDPVDPEAEESAQRIQVFWALLLMASRSQVELSQETFYEDLAISPCFVSYAHSA